MSKKDNKSMSPLTEGRIKDAQKGNICKRSDLRPIAPPPLVPPKGQYICDVCGPIENNRHKNFICRFLKWIDKR